MRDIPDLFAALQGSKFRRRFKLGVVERQYIEAREPGAILTHARKFISERLAPANPLNDGSQTPMRGHPVFIAQHATATCCRSCLEKWHGIAKGEQLSEAEIDYVVRVLMFWLEQQHPPNCDAATKAGAVQRQLFE